LASCFNKQKVEEPDMYEPSELALLMRQMEAENLSLRRAILEDDSLIFPQAYHHLNTSRPTQEGTIDENFKAFSAAYTQSMNNLQEGDSNIVYRFNQGVQACVSCHQQFCGGPIERIQQLIITD